MNFSELFYYHPAQGKLLWRPRLGKAQFNSRFAGVEAGTACSRRGDKPHMMTVGIGNKRKTVHRIVWEMMHGPIPDGMLIDHIDGDPLNNRIDNLRCVSNSENLCNRGATRVNALGLKGVYPTRCGTYQAKIKKNYRSFSLGTFPTKGLAALAYAKASLMHHGRQSIFARNA